MTTSIKITSLTNIGANIAYTTLVPVVNMTGTPETQKANLQIVGNLILSGAGGANFARAAQANIALSVANANQPNITSLGNQTFVNVAGNLLANGYIGANGNVLADNLIVTGNVQGNFLIGNGSQITGLQSLQGTQGIQGITGAGTQGVAGSTGIQGIAGSNGIQGVAGSTGIQGITGSNGIQGIAGSTGIQGIAGSNGTQGVAGSNGTQGITGSNGIQGITGSNGTQGITGTQGLQGIQSVQGIQGIQGITGTIGPSLTANLDANSFSISNVGNITVSGNISGNTNGFAIGYLNIPQIAASNTTLAATDGGKHYYSTTAGNLTLTIPNNATTSFATGTAVSIVVQAAGNVLVNAVSGVTLYMAGNSTAANRYVGSYGMATLMKVGTDTWFINGTGVN